MNTVNTQVTQTIIDALKKGTPPWERPWHLDLKAKGLPYNPLTQANYRGINILILWGCEIECAYPASAWLTFNQARKLGGRVKRGEKATQCVFVRLVKIEDKAAKEAPADKTTQDPDNTKTILIRKNFSLFNIAQLTGVDHSPVKLAFDPIPAAEHLLQSSGAKITYGASEAAYNLETDQITLPHKTAFKTVEDFYATALHELIHWTGHQQRLNRSEIQQYYGEFRAFEELIAEIGSAFLCAEIGLAGRRQHAAYIKSWLAILAEDERAIFRAASQANKACQYLQQGKTVNPTANQTTT